MTPQQIRTDVSFKALPVLLALCSRPMNRIELRRQLQTTASHISKYLGELLDHGLVVERLDRKFQVIVALRYDARPEVGGKAVMTPEPLPQGKLFEPAPLEAVEAAVAPKAPVRAPVVSELPPRGLNGKYERGPMSHTAKRIAQTMNVPGYLPNKGEVAVVQQVGECVGCKITTPFRWGSHVICPKCARKAAEV